MASGFDDSLEGLTELTQALIFTIMVYYQNRIQMRTSQGRTCGCRAQKAPRGESPFSSQWSQGVQDPEWDPLPWGLDPHPGLDLRTSSWLLSVALWALRLSQPPGWQKDTPTLGWGLLSRLLCPRGNVPGHTGGSASRAGWCG